MKLVMSIQPYKNHAMFVHASLQIDLVLNKLIMALAEKLTHENAGASTFTRSHCVYVFQESVIKSIDLYSYKMKKEEFESAFNSAKSKSMRIAYQKSIKQTESAFKQYEKFYSAFSKVLEGEIKDYQKLNADFENQIDSLRAEKDDISSHMLNSLDNEQLYGSFESHSKLRDTFIYQVKSQKKLADDTQSMTTQFLSLILETTFNTLFKGIYLMDLQSANTNAAKEFVAFSVGLTVFGPWASGVVTVANTIKFRAIARKSADDINYYLESYQQSIDVWEQVTESYIVLLDNWETNKKT
tara:strand:- start:559 stop:1452 length:894 start_codon:yes stop_codon:yes gene_type:complete